MFEKVKAQYMKDVNEHALMCKADPYYDYTCGSGVVPSPCCKYCQYYEDPYCMKDVNNWDITSVPNKEEYEWDEYHLCEDYRWNGEWEEE